MIIAENGSVLTPALHLKTHPNPKHMSKPNSSGIKIPDPDAEITPV